MVRKDIHSISTANRVKKRRLSLNGSILLILGFGGIGRSLNFCQQAGQGLRRQAALAHHVDDVDVLQLLNLFFQLCVSGLELADVLRVLCQLGTELLQFGTHKITLLIRADAQK